MDNFGPLRLFLEENGVRDFRSVDLFLALVREVRLGPGENLIRAGSPVREVYFLVEGWIKYFQTGAEGKEYVRYFCRGGHFVSVYSSLVTGTPSTFTVRTLSEAHLFSFAWKDWLELVPHHPELKALQDGLLHAALAWSEERERSLVLDDAAARYQFLLGEFPGIEDHVRQYDIAGWLGITPVALSRIRGRKAPK